MIPSVVGLASTVGYDREDVERRVVALAAELERAKLQIQRLQQQLSAASGACLTSEVP